MADTKKPKLTPEQRKAKRAADFRRLANQRVPATLKRLDQLSNLAGANYERTPEQTAKVLAAVKLHYDALCAAFAGAKDGQTFSV